MLQADTVVQGRYRVIRQIGKGGMGTVYLARDENLGVMVALKQNFFDDERLIEAFKRESRLLAGLRHSALPQVKDYFINDTGQYLVMEYIAGDDFGTILEKRQQNLASVGEPKPFEVSEIAHWAEQLLDALDYLHTLPEPVIHRDIKPQNLKLAERNQIVLLDFGLAKGKPQWMTRVTTTGSIYGYTPNYAPLEQIRGVGTDPRSDLYALGATLYHLITGAPPVDAATRAEMVLSGDPDPLLPANEVNPQVPQGVAELLKVAMEPARNKRPSSAAEMLEMLRAVKHSTVLDLRAYEPVEPSRDTDIVVQPEDTTLTPEMEAAARIKDEQRRNAAAEQRRQQEDEARKAKEAAARKAQEEAERRQREAEERLRQQREQEERERQARAEAAALQAQREREERERQTRVEAEALRQEQERKAQAEAERRRQEEERKAQAEAEALRQREAELQKQQEAQRRSQQETARSEPQKQIAGRQKTVIAAGAGAVFLAAVIWAIVAMMNKSDTVSPNPPSTGKPADTTAPTRLKAGAFTTQNKVTEVSFSDDGRFLAAAGEEAIIRLWQPDSERQLSSHKGIVKCVALSHDGRLVASGVGHEPGQVDVPARHDDRLVASGGSDNTILLQNTSDGQTLKTLTGHTGMVFSVGFSLDGQTLFSASYDKTIKLWRVSDGSLIKTVSTPEKDYLIVAVSPDLRLAGFYRGDGTFKLWSLERDELIRLLDGDVPAVNCGAVSPDGQTLALGSSDGKVELWRVSDGRLMKPLGQFDREAISLAFSADGRVLAAGFDSGAIRLWRISDGQLITTFTGHKASVNSLSFSADGRALASGSDDKTVRIWDVAEK